MNTKLLQELILDASLINSTTRLAGQTGLHYQIPVDAPRGANHEAARFEVNIKYRTPAWNVSALND